MLYYYNLWKRKTFIHLVVDVDPILPLAVRPEIPNRSQREAIFILPILLAVDAHKSYNCRYPQIPICSLLCCSRDTYIFSRNRSSSQSLRPNRACPQCHTRSHGLVHEHDGWLDVSCEHIVSYFDVLWHYLPFYRTVSFRTVPYHFVSYRVVSAQARRGKRKGKGFNIRSFGD